MCKAADLNADGFFVYIKHKLYFGCEGIKRLKAFHSLAWGVIVIGRHAEQRVDILLTVKGDRAIYPYSVDQSHTVRFWRLLVIRIRRII